MLYYMSELNTTKALVAYLQAVTATATSDAKTYIPDIHYGKVIKVYDGDTITIVTPLHNGDLAASRDLYKFNVRIAGIDTPELKSKKTNTGERELGVLARDALAALIMNKVLRLENIGYDKYGRILCDLYLNDIDISKWLIANKHATPYGGGTKTKVWT
jgi:endonuclease YncB( thermonuclease family)